MKNNFLYFISLVLSSMLMISCAKKGDKYIGNWGEANSVNLIIKKAGDKGFYLKKNYNNYYCTFEDGCFVFTNIKGVKIQIACVDSNDNLIDIRSGTTYKKHNK